MDSSRPSLAQKSSDSPSLDVTSPNGAAVWRFGSGGRLLKSTDRGTTWHAQPSGVTSDLLAGSAPSASVCWLVGRDGTVIVTSDSEHWSSRPLPARLDLVVVEAIDARQAIVTARDGRRFATSDGGTTWRTK
jgi:photosystem II stability/assembly factor-like uncharacterized protein